MIVKDNEQLIEALASEANLERVGFLLESRSNSLERLTNKIDAENLQFGEYVDDKSFNRIYASVCDRIYRFLDMAPLVNPDILLSQEYDDEYDPDTMTMKLRNSKSKILATSLAHEMGHHICNLKGKGDEFSFFGEGFSRGLEREIAREYSNDERDCTYLYEITHEDTMELCKTYLWLCDIYSRKPQKDLLRFNTKEEFLFTYCLGNTYFLLLETDEGKNVYRKTFAE